MPVKHGTYKQRAPECRRPPKWSYKRGGCRLTPGHTGDCKPGRRY